MIEGNADRAGRTGGSTAGEEASRGPLRVLGILALLLGFASISTDLYLPALPTMATALHSSPGSMEFTITGYLIGFSLGQLFWGPIGDRFGRRIPVAIGIVLFVIGSAGCAMAGNATALIVSRFVQAAGACAGVVLARAMVRDLYAGSRAAQMLSTLMIVMAIAPLLGPILGGQILGLAGWRAIFWILVGIGVVTFGAVLSLPETLPMARRNEQALTRALSRYGFLLRQRRLMAFAGSGGFFFAGTFAYVAGSPFAYIGYHHVPAQFYGLIFGAGIIGIMALNFANARLVLRFGIERMLIAGAWVAALAGVVASIDAWNDWGGVLGLAAPLFAFVAVTGWIVANSVAGAMADHPEHAGAASALVGAIQYGAGIFGSALVGAFADGTPLPMALVVALSGTGCLLCARFLPVHSLKAGASTTSSTRA